MPEVRVCCRCGKPATCKIGMYFGHDLDYCGSDLYCEECRPDRSEREKAAKRAAIEQERAAAKAKLADVVAERLTAHERQLLGLGEGT